MLFVKDKYAITNNIGERSSKSTQKPKTKTSIGRSSGAVTVLTKKDKNVTSSTQQNK